MTDPVQYFYLFSAGFLGLCLGSFATALIYRIPRGLSWIRDGNRASRSKCPYCDTILRAPDLIPIVSWLAFRGRCRHCGAPIGRMYPLIELACFIVVMMLYVEWGAFWFTIPILLLVPFLIAHIVIDWDHMILPNDINIAIFILSVLFLLLGGAGDAWMGHLIAAIFLPLSFWGVSFLLRLWKGRDTLGMGDLKFLPSVGLLLGLQGIPSYFVASGLLGLATGFYWLAQGKKGAFPFGPALVISLFLHLFLTGYGFEYTW